jgi:hypothetical protein
MSAARLPTASMMGSLEGSAPPRQGSPLPYGTSLAGSALTRLSGHPRRLEPGDTYALDRLGTNHIFVPKPPEIG